MENDFAGQTECCLTGANFDSEEETLLSPVFFSLQIIVSVKMFVTFSFIKVHSLIVMFTLLVRGMKLTMMHAGETEWLARISVRLLLYAHSEYKRALLYSVSEMFRSVDFCWNAKRNVYLTKMKWNAGKISRHVLLKSSVYFANPAELIETCWHL